MTTRGGALRLPSHQRYSCKRCGDGCHIFNEYPLDGESQERMKGLGVEDLLPSELRAGGYSEPAVLDPSKTVLKRRSGDRACVFRDGDMLCSIHREHGLEAKPRVCQDFPYRFVTTPNGVYPGVSFACTAVLENYGELLSEQEGELADLLKVSGAVTVRTDPVALTDLHQFGWEAWECTVGALDAILRVPGHSIGECLVAQAVYLDLLTNLVVELRRNHPAPTPANRKDPPMPWPADCGQQSDLEAATAMAKQFTEGEGMNRLFGMAARARAIPATRRTLLGLMASFRGGLDAAEKRPSRLAAISRILGTWFFQATGLGPLRLPGVPDSFGRRDLEGVAIDMTSPEFHDLLMRYFSHALFRQDLLLARNAWIGQRWQLLHFALIRDYAAAEALHRGSRSVKLEDVRMAVRQVEKYFVFHGGFQRLFDRYPALGQLFDNAAAKKTYPASMVATGKGI